VILCECGPIDGGIARLAIASISDGVAWVDNKHPADHSRTVGIAKD
jgi:hypothetical protein